MSNGLCKFLSEKPHKNQNSLRVIYSFRPEKFFSMSFCLLFFFFFLFLITGALTRLDLLPAHHANELFAFKGRSNLKLDAFREIRMKLITFLSAHIHIW
jgi:hypothetical protein